MKESIESEHLCCPVCGYSGSIIPKKETMHNWTKEYANTDGLTSVKIQKEKTWKVFSCRDCDEEFALTTKVKEIKG